MRKKLLFGTIVGLALAAALGERYFNRAVGQDVPLPKAPEPEKKDLFDLLKKDLEAKKEAPTFPALPTLKKDEAQAPPALPPLPASKDDKVLITPPAPVGGNETPKPTIPPVVSDKKSDKPLFDGGTPQPPILQSTDKATSEKPLPETKKEDAPPLPDPVKIDAKVPQTIFPSSPPLSPVAEPKPSAAPMAVALPKNSPWSLNVVMVDGQTVVTAVVNKKHEFKILCQTLDLQTGKGTLKASGKVQINGDALNGTCEHLSITLMEDRLLLEGKAIVSIDRTSANVSDAAPANFELKGDTLNLRISELQPASIQDAYIRPVANTEGPALRVVTASLKMDGTQWTPYGRLRALKSSDNMWSLESSNGSVIAYLLAREGGSLERYVGQNISVYGTRERERAGQPVLRVTHIALP